MSAYHVALIILGIAILGVAWLPSLLERFPLSYPIIYVVLGWVAASLPIGTYVVSPIGDAVLVTRLAELCVLIALTGTGLKIDRPFSRAVWRLPLRLVLLLMPITIAIVALGGRWLGLSLGGAIVLAAALAPTEPVLAADVQVGEPGEGGEDKVRFALTGEAGLNDGLAFPFVFLGIALLAPTFDAGDLGHWVLVDVGYRVGAAIALGLGAGSVLAWLIFRLPRRFGFRPTAYGFVVVAVTVITYGVTELVHAYGFLAVFIAALTLRNRERDHEYHRQMHAFTDQLERLLVVVILIGLGAALEHGILAPLTWRGVVVGLGLLLVVRPLAGYATLAWGHGSRVERATIAAFGIRGIGSIFYVGYATSALPAAELPVIWAVTAFTIAASILLHGVAATPVMAWVDRRHGRTGGSVPLARPSQ